MDTVVVDIKRIRMVLTMFAITQGELARASNTSTAMVSLILAGQKRPSIRTAVAIAHGVEKLLTDNHRLDTAFFIKSERTTIATPPATAEPPRIRRPPRR